MDKGIRPAVNAKFKELLPQRAEMGNTAFRKAVMEFAMSEYNITLASASTHYNHAFKVVKAADPTVVEGLGRPEDKKGGRKPKAKTAAEVQTAVEAVAAQIAVDIHEETAPMQTAFTVRRKSDDTVVAEGLSFEDARAMTVKAAAAKKAKLYWI